jgi:hypothetical protein
MDSAPLIPRVNAVASYDIPEPLTVEHQGRSLFQVLNQQHFLDGVPDNEMAPN